MFNYGETENRNRVSEIFKNKIMDMIFDEHFKVVQGLKWLPWVGENFPSIPMENKILLIGESHYYNPDEKGSLEKHNDEGYTRVVIKGLGIEKEYKRYENKKIAPKMYSNIHYTFLGNDSSDSTSFWNKVAYYNFIQEAMNSNNGRPSKTNITDAWQTFDDLINILNPTTCIFLGNSAYKYFPNQLKQKCIFPPTYDKKTNNSIPKEIRIKLNNGQNLQILMIKHPSNYYSWSAWNEYLTIKLPNLMSWIKE
jgi:hypothetical protein